MKNSKYIVFLLVSIIAILMFFFNKQLYQKKIQEEEIINYNYVKTDFMKDIITCNQFIILYYTELDCESCISVGYNIINRLSEKNRRTEFKYFIIRSSEKIISDSILYFNKLPILKDPQMIIKKTLHYIPTPIIIFGNHGNVDSSVAITIKNDLTTEKSIKNIASLNKLMY